MEINSSDLQVLQQDRRKFIWKTACAYGALATGYLLEACAAAALPFITMGLNLIGTILPTIPSIIAAISGLTGKTIPSTEVNKLTQIFVGVQDLFKQAQDALNQYQASNDTTLITKIQDILNQVKTRLASALADTQITDPATVSKITLVVNSFVDLANNILAILPQVVNGKAVARKVSRAQRAQVTPEAWAKKFNAAAHSPSGNAAVDAAFSKVNAVPKS
jgi:hypothetical protein